MKSLKALILLAGFLVFWHQTSLADDRPWDWKAYTVQGLIILDYDITEQLLDKGYEEAHAIWGKHPSDTQLLLGASAYTWMHVTMQNKHPKLTNFWNNVNLVLRGLVVYNNIKVAKDNHESIRIFIWTTQF